MNWKTAWLTLLLAALFVGHAKAMEPEGPPNQVTQQAQPSDKNKELPPPETDVFAQAPPATGEVPTGFNPHMMGDFGALFALQRITIFGIQTRNDLEILYISGNPVNTESTTTTTTTTRTASIRVPVATLGAFKIADNGSPRPQDRVFLTYNFFGDMRGPETAANVPQVTNQTSTQTTVMGPIALTDTITINNISPGAQAARVDLNREVFGFEKTFLNGRASFEVRAPILQQQSPNGFGAQDFCDLLDQDTGNVISGGLGVTVPTGSRIVTVDGNIDDTLLQPYVGYIWNAGRFYFQGFHSLVVGTGSQFPTLLFNDIGLDYWLYTGAPDRFLSSIVPTVEAHLNTPLNHRGENDPLIAPDLLVFTGGVHLGLFQNATLTLGAATPVTGPHLFAVEAFAQFNWRF
jgi:hypothetical protein